MPAYPGVIKLVPPFTCVSKRYVVTLFSTWSFVYNDSREHVLCGASLFNQTHAGIYSSCMQVHNCMFLVYLAVCQIQCITEGNVFGYLQWSFLVVQQPTKWIFGVPWYIIEHSDYSFKYVLNPQNHPCLAGFFKGMAMKEAVKPPLTFSCVVLAVEARLLVVHRLPLVFLDCSYTWS